MIKKFEVSEELANKVYRLVEEVRSSGKLRKGTNEVTKSIERGDAKLVIVADDINPQEIIMHIPMLADEKKIPFIFVPKKDELGAAAGLPVSTSAIAILNPGEGAKSLKQVISSIESLRKPKTIPKEEKTEAKKAEPAETEKAKKKETPKESVKEEKPAETVKEEKPAETVKEETKEK